MREAMGGGRRLHEGVALVALSALTACGALVGFGQFAERTDGAADDVNGPGAASDGGGGLDGGEAGNDATLDGPSPAVDAEPPPCSSPFQGGSRLVLYGGRLEGMMPVSDVWTFDGTTWTARGNAANKVTRHAMATRGTEAISFGGTRQDEMPHDDTQRFVAGAWVASTTPPTIPHRAEAAMAPVGAELLLFGGTSGTAFFGDTWLSAPTDAGDLTWNEATTKTPGPRHGHAMATLAEAGTLLYGGRLQDSGFIADSVVWDGLSWLKHAHFTTAGTDHPSARAYHAMATVGCKVVMFGGLDGSGPLGDTWEWDGRVSPSTWVRKAQGQAAPTPRYGHAMATLNGTVILFGGRDKSMHNSETWTWNGSRWDNVTNKLVGTPPPPRAHHGMAAYTQ